MSNTKSSVSYAIFTLREEITQLKIFIKEHKGFKDTKRANTLIREQIRQCRVAIDILRLTT